MALSNASMSPNHAFVSPGSELSPSADLFALVSQTTSRRYRLDLLSALKAGRRSSSSCRAPANCKQASARQRGNPSSRPNPAISAVEAKGFYHRVSRKVRSIHRRAVLASASLPAYDKNPGFSWVAQDLDSITCTLWE
eukprot:scaffold21703_cov33-Prasinocladus_malaysianus.AAC.1